MKFLKILGPLFWGRAHLGNFSLGFGRIFWGLKIYFYLCLLSTSGEREEKGGKKNTKGDFGQKSITLVSFFQKMSQEWFQGELLIKSSPWGHFFTLGTRSVLETASRGYFAGLKISTFCLHPGQDNSGFQGLRRILGKFRVSDPRALSGFGNFPKSGKRVFALAKRVDPRSKNAFFAREK